MTTCNCRSHSKPEWGGTRPEIIMPYQVYFPDAQPVSIDECIAPEMLALWREGVRTIGCCCGHNGNAPFAGGRANVIVQEPDARMARLILSDFQREWWIMVHAGQW